MDNLRSIYPDPDHPPKMQENLEEIKFPPDFPDEYAPPPQASKPQIISPKDESSKVKKSKLSLVLIVILGIIIALGIFYFFFMPPKWMLYIMSRRITNIKSLAYKSEFKAEFSVSNFNSPLLILKNTEKVAGVNSSEVPVDINNQEFSGAIVMNTNGQLDWTDIYNPKGSFILDSLQLKENNNTLDIASGEIRVPDSNIYLKINDISKVIFNFDLSQVKNKWYFVEQKEPFIPEDEITQEKVDKTKDLSKKYQIIKVTKRLRSESIENNLTYHYQYILDKDAMANFLADSVEINGEKMSAARKDNLIKDFKNAMKGIEITGEIWIGKFDFYPHKILTTIAIKDDLFPRGRGTLAITLTLSNINKPIKVDVPTGALPYSEFEKVLQEQIIAKYKPQSYPTTSLGGKDSDNDNLSDDLEKIYGTNPNNPDTDGDGFKDGDEVQKGYNPLGQGMMPLY
ncbi:MAG: hypothetical protein HW405_667 [Candidatus Berkelbacteria bacterium]|nr:hypothetical protein [Candidatus Berkelbacteria bacterium]